VKNGGACCSVVGRVARRRVVVVAIVIAAEVRVAIERAAVVEVEISWGAMLITATGRVQGEQMQ